MWESYIAQDILYLVLYMIPTLYYNIIQHYIIMLFSIYAYLNTNAISYPVLPMCNTTCKGHLWRAYPWQSLFATCNFALLAQKSILQVVSSNRHMCALPVNIKLPLSCTVYVFDCSAVLALICGQMIMYVATMCGQIHDCLVIYCVIHKWSYGYSGIWDSIGWQGIMWTYYVHLTIHVWLYVRT